MDATGLIIFLAVGAIAGWLAGVVVRGGGFGLLGNIVVGIVGALLGSWLFKQLGVRVGADLVNSIVTAFIGAVVLLLIVVMIKRA